MGHTSIISLHIQRAQDLLLKSRLISPERSLIDGEIHKFLLEAVENIPRKHDVALIIKVEETDPVTEPKIAEAIHKHFSYSTEIVERKVTEIIQLGWKSLLIGSAFLLLTVFIVVSIGNGFPENSFLITIRELFIILAWVALWRPADLLLYEWRAINKKGKLFKKLANCSVTFQSIAEGKLLA